MSDPKLKFIIVVDDKGTPVVKSFGNSLAASGTKAKGLAGNITGIATAAAKTTAKLTALGAAGATALAGFTFTKIISEFATFETELTRLANLGVADLEAVKQQIMALPPELGNATELVAGYYEVLSSGITDTTAAIDTLTTASQLAKTAHLEQATAVQAVTAGMKAFDTDAKTVAESLMAIEKSGVTTVAKLAPIFGEVAGTAAAVNINLEATSAALAAVTQMSGSTEKGATQLLGVFKEMIQPTKAMDELFVQYGGTMRAIEAIGFDGVLARIAENTGGSAEKTAELVTSQEALKGLLTLTAQDMRFFNEAMGAQQEKTGALEAAWSQYGNTFRSIWETAKNLIGEQATLIGEKLAPKVKEVIRDFSKWLQVNQELIQVKIGAWIDDMAARMGTVDFDALATDARNFYQALKDIAGVLNEMMNPIDTMGKKWDAFWNETSSRARKFFSGDWAGYLAEMRNGWQTTLADMETDPVSVDVDISGALAETDRLMHEIDAMTLMDPVPIDADASAAEREVAEFVSDTEARRPDDIPVDADTSPASAAATGLVDDIDGMSGTITVNADTTAAEANLAALTQAAARAAEAIEDLAGMNRTAGQTARAVEQVSGSRPDVEAVSDAMDNIDDKTDRWGNPEYQPNRHTSRGIGSVDDWGHPSLWGGTSVYKYAKMQWDAKTSGRGVGPYAQRLWDMMQNPIPYGAFAAGGPVWAGKAAGGMAIGPSHLGGGILAEFEGGEYITNKRAVDHYGADFMDAINTMRLPKPGSASGGAGSVVRQGDTYHITVAPQIMTGDAAGGRRAADAIARILDERQKRR